MFKYFLILFLMSVSFFSFSDEKEICNIHASPTSINYDTLTNWNTNKKDGDTYAGKRLVNVSIECNEITHPYVDFPLIGSSLHDFQLNTSSTVILEANNGSIDGKSVPLESMDINKSDTRTIISHDVKIKPGTRIFPEKKHSGKIFTFNLLIDLKINSINKKGGIISTSIPLTSSGSALNLDISYSEISTACKVITDSNTIDYGTLNRNNLNPNNYTLLPEKNINFAIQCESGKTAVAIQVLNQMDKSLAPNKQEGTGGYGIPPINLLSNSSMMSGGLGLTNNGIPIGGYAIALDQTSLTIDDSKQVTPISSNSSCNDTNMVWHPSDGNLLANSTPNMIVSWAEQGTLLPALFTSMQGVIKVQAFLNKASLLRTNESIKFKGRSILELCYL